MSYSRGRKDLGVRGTTSTATGKFSQLHRQVSGTEKHPPPHTPSPPAQSTVNMSFDSPLTPIPPTPHPDKGKAVSKPPPPGPTTKKDGGLTKPTSNKEASGNLFSDLSSVPPSQAPSSMTGIASSKDSSPQMPAAPSLLFPNLTVERDPAVNLNSPRSVPLPPDQPEEEDAVEHALQIVRDLDVSFHRKREGDLWSWDSLEKKVKGYANYKELRPEDVEDHGITISGSQARFRVRRALIKDVLDVAEEFENLLLSLRSMDPDRPAEGAWKVDAKSAFVKALEGARTLASLNLAWRGLAGRFNNGYHVYAKYLARAYHAYGAYEGEPPASPSSTAASVYQEMDRYPLAEEKVRYAIGALPGAQIAGSLPNDPSSSERKRDRLVNLPDRVILATPPRLREHFPECEPEENPTVISYEGYRHYEWKGRREEEEEAERERARKSKEQGDREAQRLWQEKIMREQQRNREREEERRRKAAEEARARKRQEEERARQAERTRQEEEDERERRRREERRHARLEEEKAVRAHERVFEREQAARAIEDEEYRRLYDQHLQSRTGLYASLLGMMKTRVRKEEGIVKDAHEQMDLALDQGQLDVQEVEIRRATCAAERAEEAARREQMFEEGFQRKIHEDKRKDKVEFAGWEYVPEKPEVEKPMELEEEDDLDERADDGDDEEGWEEDESGFPETPAPRGRGRRGGRRTSAFSFFGQTTPRTTPFGSAVLPPPLQQGTTRSASRRRRSGLVNIPGAFGGAPPPDGGDSSDNNDEGRGRRPPPGPNGGGGGRPPPPPPNNGQSGIPGDERGNGRSHRGGGGGPPGDPPGGSQGSAAVGNPRAPYGNTAPTIHPVLKSSNVPSWDGNRATAISYFWKINQLARSGGYLPEALGFWLWQKLVEGSSVELWYMTVSDDTKDWMQTNATQWIQGVVDVFLGRRWVNQIASEFKQQGFREGHKYRFESPQDYISRRLMHARFLGYSKKGLYEEVQLVIERIPSHWHHMLSTSTVRNADELKERAIEFEAELMADHQHDSGDIEASVSSVLRKMGITPSTRSSQPRSSFKRVAFSAEPGKRDDEEPPALTAVSDAEESGESSSEGEQEPWEEILATAYSVVQRRPPASDKKYPFERRNNVRTSAKKPPPAPCFACGSPYHWNRECPHRDKYLASRRREGNSVEPGDAAREKAYNAAWAIVSDPGFEGAVPEDTFEPEECKTQERREEEQEGESEPEDVNERPEERTNGPAREEVLFVNTPNVASQIEVVEEEYWQAGGTLPADHPHLMEYVGSDAKWCAQPDFDLNCERGAIEREAFAIPDVKPFEDPPRKLKARIKKPPGYASVGTSVLSVRCKLSSLEDEEIDGRLDSGASLSLLSADQYDQLKNPPPIKKGAKMKLWQLTSSSAPMRGYVRLPVFVATDHGVTLEMEVEVYVVEGMTVPLLLGEDFQQAYEVSVDRRIDKGTRVFFGDAENATTAVSVNRTSDYSRVAKSYCGEVPEQSFAKKAHRNRLRRERRKRAKLAKEEDFLVRAAQDVRIPAETVARVPLQGQFAEEGEWVVEKTLLSTSDSPHLAVPNTLISGSCTYVPVANLAQEPKMVRRGEVLGRIVHAADFFDTPSSTEEKTNFERHASFLKTACDLNLGEAREQDAAKAPPHQHKTAAADRHSRPTRMPDKNTYAAWANGGRPAKRRFFMPDKESYSTWVQGEEEEQDDYGPKTAALPETEDVASEKFKEILDVGALPEHLKEKAWEMLLRHRKAFALDGRLGDYEAAARIRVKEGTEPIAVPMFGASPRRSRS
ncbi:uncharacterized protein SCHCODRAFT_01094336 [Schizophyllum commune H4-8]|uniref:CCHC-type domain-containing protein n=1 Tax=Schizophyllum commune (strain H4-8 / FGSC 9210) TaxID=578458 RepID=D8Q546_SCHCM|nr:uncharacterized protein SCHCODRAFT_01094336 [Schizophyllum commune H4-8]KAI5892345.1 hypothetical protein SCHCODRAFT_01094336 [Schizophyllum commune H4-8]